MHGLCVMILGLSGESENTEWGRQTQRLILHCAEESFWPESLRRVKGFPMSVWVGSLNSDTESISLVLGYWVSAGAGGESLSRDWFEIRFRYGMYSHALNWAGLPSASIQHSLMSVSSKNS